MNARLVDSNAAAAVLSAPVLLSIGLAIALVLLHFHRGRRTLVHMKGMLSVWSRNSTELWYLFSSAAGVLWQRCSRIVVFIATSRKSLVESRALFSCNVKSKVVAVKSIQPQSQRSRRISQAAPSM